MHIGDKVSFRVHRNFMNYREDREGEIVAFIPKRESMQEAAEKMGIKSTSVSSRNVAKNVDRWLVKTGNGRYSAKQEKDLTLI
jgi:hypothetical protein